MTVCCMETKGHAKFHTTSRMFVNSMGSHNINISRQVHMYQGKRVNTTTPVAEARRSWTETKAPVLTASAVKSRQIKLNAIETACIAEDVAADPDFFVFLEDMFPVDVEVDCQLPSQSIMRNTLTEKGMGLDLAKQQVSAYYGQIKYQRRRCRVEVAIRHFNRAVRPS